MKTTFVLSLDPENAAFMEEVRNRLGVEDPNEFINQILRKERQQLGLPAKEIKKSSESIELENFVDTQIPSGG
jgi:hypothetical protein